jgi:hypothetical protein
MATFGALRHPWHRLLHPNRTHVLCPLDLCRLHEFRRRIRPVFGEESATVLCRRMAEVTGSIRPRPRRPTTLQADSY